jgi:uncharacterized membrane protein YphA (DoxX/SURF4 family)
MNGLTRYFLVLLRIAIGWHFLFEGLAKIDSVDLVGPTTTNRPWTSRGYLREASGPAAPLFRKLVGDPDAEALELFTVRPLEPGEDPAKVKPGERLSPLLVQSWDRYFERFAEHYQLSSEPHLQRVFLATVAFAPQSGGPTPVPWAALVVSSQEDPVQYRNAQAKLAQARANAERWLLGESGTREIERAYGPLAVFKVKQTSSQRLAEYREKVAEVRRITETKNFAFGRDVEHGNLTALKVDVNRLRTELLADLETPMQETLGSVLTDEQKKLGPVTVPANNNIRNIRQWDLMDWIDGVTRYGLTLVGLLLIIGLFSRSACLGGAAFLLLFYAAMPALPWLPEPPRAEGHYLFINKNIIELLALLALATTRSGCWVGLDGLVQFLLPWRWFKRRV